MKFRVLGGRAARAGVGVLVATVATAGVAASAAAAGPSTYLVLYKQEAVPTDAAATIAKAGGTLVQAYDQIGVAVARSSSASFASAMGQNAKVDVTESTGGFAVQLADQGTGNGPAPGNAPAADSDSLSGLQWDMRQINTPQAHAISGGSPAIVVGDIDTGLDKDHPDLQANIDFGRSVSCLGGVPNTSPAAWDDDHGHGTHTAGTIAAASNGFGIVGVAPNVRVAGIKAATSEGYFFPEAVVCAFYWAATHGIHVTNNSYFADPWLFNCKNDPGQRAIWEAERRAIRFAQKQGVTVIASEGNDSDDLRHPQVDNTSPDFPPGSETPGRPVDNKCFVIPVEIEHVIGVSALGAAEQTDGKDGKDYLKSFYSSYGEVEVAAPGGDSIFGAPFAPPNGRVLSTWPAEIGCAREVLEGATKYCYAQGTSMAAPHVAGVAALIHSVRGPQKPDKVRSILEKTADPQPCPTELPAGYETFTRPSGDAQTCYGGHGNNAWYGHGQVDALAAVLKK